MNESGFNLDVFLANKLMVLYAKCGSLMDARRVLDEMPVRNVASWTAMIQAYSKHGHDEKPWSYFAKCKRMTLSRINSRLPPFSLPVPTWRFWNTARRSMKI
jgi:pentatricopeptide repeat protein